MRGRRRATKAGEKTSLRSFNFGKDSLPAAERRCLCGTVLAQRKSVGSFQAFDFPSRIGNALVSYVAYLWQMLYPAGLAVFYPHPQTTCPVGRWAFPCWYCSSFLRASGPDDESILTSWWAGCGIWGCLCLSSASCRWETRPGGPLHLPASNRIVCSGGLGGKGTL